MSGVIYKYMCGRCNSTYYGEVEKQLKVRSREHIGISPLTFKNTKTSKESSKPCLFRGLPSWQMEIVNLFLKSKKACLLNEI